MEQVHKEFFYRNKRDFIILIYKGEKEFRVNVREIVEEEEKLAFNDAYSNSETLKIIVEKVKAKIDLLA